MKVISTGGEHNIYPDDLLVRSQLPPETFLVSFSNKRGFYLTDHGSLVVEEKIYGPHLAKADKVMRSFAAFTRNLGVILSGDKGTGKSLFAKALCQTANRKGLPVILVDRACPGISGFIESIEQEAVILFDEFDKTFGSVTPRDGEADIQIELLSMFDGVACGEKKLFVITCNDLGDISRYLINRPGRFHYHFRFAAPTSDEIRQYLTDTLESAYCDQIEPVVSFATRVPLTYDCLRAIAFELNAGEPFKDAIADLNIVNYQSLYYDLRLNFADGTVLTHEDVRIDFFDESVHCLKDVSMFGNLDHTI